MVIVTCYACSVLVHPRDRGIDHLDRRVVTGGQGIHNPVPNASLPPTDKAIVASGAGTNTMLAGRATERLSAEPKRCHSGRAGRQHGERHAACFGRNDRMARHSKSVSSYRMIRCSGSDT